MNKILLLLALFVATSWSAQKNVGIQAGFNLSKMQNKNDAIVFSADYKLKPGFNAGLNFELPFNNYISSELAANFSTGGYKYDSEDRNATGTMTTYNLQVPLSAKITIPINKINVFASVGPYIGFFLSGKFEEFYDASGTIGDVDETFKIKRGKTDGFQVSALNDPYHIQTLDVGINTTLGAEINGIYLTVNYLRGLKNIHGMQDQDFLLQNRDLSFNLGYKFKFGSDTSERKSSAKKPSPRKAVKR